MINNIVAFADESGNNSFDFQKQGTHFIVAAIILPKEKQLELESQIELVRKKFFQTGEMKSSGVASNDPRRIAILQELVKLDFSIYAVSVDKQKLTTEGFKYKKSFYKFLNGLLYRELYKNFPNLNLTVDEHGSNNFMLQFKKYVQNNHANDLFSESDFEFGNSPDSILIQLADFMAGTLARCFDAVKKSRQVEDFLRILQPKITSINNFPPESFNYINPDIVGDGTYNLEIAEIAVNKARHFINTKIVNELEDIDQVNCVKLLLLYFHNYQGKKYISTSELMKHLQTGRTEELTQHVFRTKVIAPIRDAGVIIASSSAGVKLPCSIQDLNKFINHGSSIIFPVLNRIKLVQEVIKLGTQNKIDILDSPEYSKIKKILE